MAPPIYHLAREQDWAAAQSAGRYPGGAQDRRDGFIHFSTAVQIVESAAKHRTGEAGLVLLTVDPESLGGALRWEKSRGGALFPHLYGDLPVEAVMRVDPLLLDGQGQHVFPSLDG